MLRSGEVSIEEIIGSPDTESKTDERSSENEETMTIEIVPAHVVGGKIKDVENLEKKLSEGTVRGTIEISGTTQHIILEK